MYIITFFCCRKCKIILLIVVEENHVRYTKRKNNDMISKIMDTVESTRKIWTGVKFSLSKMR